MTHSVLCLVASINASQYDEQFVVLFSLTMAQLKQVRETGLCLSVCLSVFPSPSPSPSPSWQQSLMTHCLSHVTDASSYHQH